MTNAFLPRIHAASASLFVPAFQSWIDQAMDSGNPPQIFLKTILQVRDMDLFALNRHWSSVEDRLLVADLRQFQEGLQESLVGDVGMEQLEAQRSLAGATDGSQRLESLRHLYETLTNPSTSDLGYDSPVWAVLSYLAHRSAVPLRLDLTRRLLRERLGEIRSHPRVLDFLVRHPQRLAPLGLALPHLFSQEPSRALPAEDEGWMRLMGRWRRPLIFEIGSTYNLLSAWNAAPVRDGLWVDLGSGDGRTLFHLAQLHSGFRFIGVDVLGPSSLDIAQEVEERFPHWSQRPSNVEYRLITSQPTRIPHVTDVMVPRRMADIPLAALARERTLRSVGRGQASVVSILYPPRRDGRMPLMTTTDNAFSFLGLDPLPSVPSKGDHARTLLASGLDLLRPGGVGLFVTEHPAVLAGALELLSRDRRVGRIFYTSAPLNAEALEAMGIEPYRPYSADLGHGTVRWQDRYRRHGTFTWGYPVVFRMT